MDHKYDDKFALLEFMTNTGIAALKNALERLGLDDTKFETVSRLVHEEKRSVMLRFEAETACSFLKEQDVDIPSVEYTTASNTKSSSIFGGGGNPNVIEQTVRQQVIIKVKEYHWKVQIGYRVLVQAGNDHVIELQSRSSSTILVTNGGQANRHPSGRPINPLPERKIHAPLETNVTWLFKMMDQNSQTCQFSVDRSELSCKTPRRNEPTENAVDFCSTFGNWAIAVKEFFVSHLEKNIAGKHNPAKTPVAQERLAPGDRGVLVDLEQEPSFNGKAVTVFEWMPDQRKYRVAPVDKSLGLPDSLLIKPKNIVGDSPHGPSFSIVTAESILCPIIPLVERGSVLGAGDIGAFLSEQCRAMDTAIDSISTTFPPRQLVRLVSSAEATIVLLCRHFQMLAESYIDGVDYLEQMLKQQLVTAIGKEIQVSDFDQFMSFYNQKLFAQEYAPTPFTYAVRRPNHDPDGLVSIEVAEDNRPVATMVRHIPGGDTVPSIFLPINAATSIEITGDRYLHGWMQHQFESSVQSSHQLAARARQFSSFLIVVGTMMGHDKLVPKDAIIVSNKDEVLIPLLTTTLPSAKEFRDSVASLSPEQRAFAESFRAMQLESSVFGVCVIQLKPQLEAVLRLPNGSLTKEIQLTQDLMSLFVEYQIPSDLMSFDGARESEQVDKVNVVKGHVKAIMDVIQTEKEKQLKDEMLKADMREEMTSRRSEDVDVDLPAQAFMALSAASEDPMEMRMTRDNVSRGAAIMSAVGGPSHGSAAMRQKSNAAGTSTTFRQTDFPTPVAYKERDHQPNSYLVTTPTGVPSEASVGVDYTVIPRLLDQIIEKHDVDGALRSAVIKTEQPWTRRRQQNLLTSIKSQDLFPADIKDEKKKAFDLLDAITRSGDIPIDCAELHVIIGVSHCFENDLMGTVIQDNINPIEKVENSLLLFASTVFRAPAQSLLKDEERAKRLEASLPFLLEQSNASNAST